MNMEMEKTHHDQFMKFRVEKEMVILIKPQRHMPFLFLFCSGNWSTYSGSVI